jgi:hypothetical protein
MTAANQLLLDRANNVEVFLTNMIMGLPGEQNLIGEQLLPPLPQDMAEASIGKWGSESFFLIDDRIGDRGLVKKVDTTIGKTKVEVEGHALMVEVTPRERKAAAGAALPYDLWKRKLVVARRNMDLWQEYLIAQLLQDTTIYPAGNVFNFGTGGASPLSIPFDDPTKDPLPTMKTIIEETLPLACGFKPNVLWFARNAWAKFLVNAKVRAAMLGINASQTFVTEQQVATYLGVPKVVVGSALSRLDDGTLDTELWSKKCGFLYLAPQPSEETPSFGYNVKQRVFAGGTEAVFTGHEDKEGVAGYDWAKAARFYTPAALMTQAGVICTGVIS